MVGTSGDLSPAIPGPCGMGMKQDALWLTGDSHKVNSARHVGSPNDRASDYPLLREAQVAPKEKGGKMRKGKEALSLAPPASHPTNVATPDRINPRTGHRDCCSGRGMNFILIRSALARRPKPQSMCQPLRILQGVVTRMPLGEVFPYVG